MAESFKRLRLIHRDNAPDFGVEQNWLLDWYRCYTNHFEATLEELNEWLRNEYTSEDSYELYADALLADELIIQENYEEEEQSPQYVYVVREVHQNGLDVDARILCVSLDFNKAKNYYTDVKEDLLLQIAKGESDFSGEKVDGQEYEHGKAYFEVSAEDEPLSYYLSLERHILA